MRLSYPGNSTLACLGKADVRRLYRILLDLTRPANTVFSGPVFYALMAKRKV
jgi:hypothetical protein